MILGLISAPLLPSWLALLQLLQRRARRTRPARLACLQMLSACSRHANAAVQPLWRDFCVGVVHCLIVVLALLALLALRPAMCRHPAETLLLPVLPSPGCPCLSFSLSRYGCVPGEELCCAGHLLHKTHPTDQACGLHTKTARDLLNS